MKIEKKWVLLVGIFVFILGLYTLKISKKSEVLRGIAESGNLVTTEETPDGKASIDSLSERAKRCIDLAKTIKAKKQSWIISNLSVDNKLYSKGFSADEITIAMEMFRNRNFALDWRQRHFKKSSLSHARNLTLKTYFESILGYLLPSALQVRIEPPREELKKLFSLDLQEIDRDVAKFDPTVDDVAVFLKLGGYDPDKLMRILSAVEYPLELVNDRNTSLLRLIDYAAINGDARMFNYLINLGSPMSEDWYLNTTLEWALVKLHVNLEAKHDISSSVEIIEELMQRGGTAQIADSLDGGLSSPLFKFSKDEIMNLLVEHGLNLYMIEAKSSPNKVNISSSIMSYLNFELEKFLNSSIDKRDWVFLNGVCKTTSFNKEKNR